MAVPFQIDLKDKVAVVTGGGGILCSVMAKALAECGAKVAILDLREENAAKVAEEINAAGFTAMGLGANVLALLLPILFARPILLLSEFFRKKGDA